jgi:hypothetical protein
MTDPTPRQLQTRAHFGMASRYKHWWTIAQLMEEYGATRKEVRFALARCNVTLRPCGPPHQRRRKVVG